MWLSGNRYVDWTSGLHNVDIWAETLFCLLFSYSVVGSTDWSNGWPQHWHWLTSRFDRIRATIGSTTASLAWHDECWQALATSFVRQPFVSLEANLLSKAQWWLYVPSVQFNNYTFCPHTIYVFLWIWEQTAIISPYSITWLVFITETVCVYGAVRTECL
jgi:hypothetical protein